jgi:hypothetical protein
MQVRVLFSVLIVLVIGCRNHSTLFPTPQRDDHQDARVQALYFDMYGDLYPGPEVKVEAANLKDGEGLREFFARDHAGNGATWRSLVAYAGLSPAEAAAEFPVAWQSVQARLQARTKSRVRELASVEGRPVIMFVHGFNNVFKGARANYDSTRKLIDARLGPANVRYLDVYWDGMNKAGVPIGIWGEAQYNFPLIGVQMRPILAVLPSSTPLRILTHSTGGPLIATAFGPTHAAFGREIPADDWPRDVNYRDHLSRDTATVGVFAPPRFRDARVAMMIPAASANLFDDIPRTPGFSRLILGYSPRDYSVRKGWLASCRWFGATCLGTKLKDICGITAPSLARATDLDVRIIRLTNGFKYVYPGGDHAWLGYLSRPSGRRVLDVLLSTQADTSDRLTAICGTRAD